MIKAYVSDNFLGDSLRVYIIDEREDQRRMMRMNDGGLRWIDLPPAGSAINAEPEVPTLWLPFDSGRALLEALVQHYQGAEDTRQLRKDYDAERQRVDTLTSALVDIAKGVRL